MKLEQKHHQGLFFCCMFYIKTKRFICELLGIYNQKV